MTVKDHITAETMSFNVGIAEHVGITAAILLQYIIGWIRYNASHQARCKEPFSLHDGHWWMYQSYDEMVVSLPLFCRRTIIDTIGILEESGYLVKGKNPKEPMNRTNWYRLSDDLSSQIKFTKVQNLPDAGSVPENPQASGKICTMHRQADAPCTVLEKDIKEKQQQQKPAAAAAVFSCLLPLEMPQYDKEWITRTYEEPAVVAAVAVVTHPNFVLNKTLQQAVKHFCAHPSQPPKSKEETAAANKQIALELEKRLPAKMGGAVFGVFNTYAEISFIANKMPFVIEFSEPSFVEELKKKLTQYGWQL